MHLLQGFTKSTGNESNTKLMQTVFRIYDRINEPKKYYLINGICKLFLQHNAIDKFPIIWNDIESLKDKSRLHFDALLKCCIKCDKMNIQKCMDILEWTKQCNYTLSIRPIFFTKLINKCGKDLDSLKYIHSILHTDSIKLDVNAKDNIFIQTALINGYALCNDSISALNTFECIPENKRDIICIGAMMKAFVNTNKFDQALQLFDDVSQTDNIKHDNVTYLLGIKACTESSNFVKGKEIINKINLNHEDIRMVNTIINFYGNSQQLDDALNLFNSVNDKQKDIVTIGAMMDAYCKCNKDKECMELYGQIFSIYKLQPDISTYIIALTSCTNGTMYHMGEDIHNRLKQDIDNQWMLQNTDIQTCLINMYGKCGQLKNCQRIFDRIQLSENDKYYQETAIWNAMIHAYGRNGEIDSVEKLYHKMKDEIMVPMNSKTYIVLISALSHCGEVDKAENIWKYDIIDESIKYDRYVMTSLVDCFSRKGMLEKAYQIIKEREMSGKYDYDKIMWISFLSGCNKYEQKIILGDDVHVEYQKRFSSTPSNREKNTTSATVDVSSLLKDCN